MSEKPAFSLEDYVVFSLVLALSAGIGVFNAIQGKRRKKTTEKDLLLGGGNLRIVPVALSIIASFMSAIFVIGVPSEIYLHGGTYVLLNLQYLVVYPLVIFVVVPFYRNLKITSAYEYLELRFNRPVRLLGSVIFTVEMVFYMAVALYTPALALSQASSLPMGISIATVGVISTFYTAVGGMKAVVWTDAFQMVVICAGLLAVIIQGSIEVGGLVKVFEIGKEGNRLPQFDFNPDPFIRHTFWTLSVGGMFTSLTLFAGNQALIQRYLSVPRTRDAQLALCVSLPITVVTLLLIGIVGLVLYAKYRFCDPLNSGKVTSPDQTLVLFVMESFGHMKGLPGLFVACVFSASLSTVSSGVNALAAVSLKDFLQPAYFRIKAQKMGGLMSSWCSVVLAMSFGGLTIGLAYLVGVLGKTVLILVLSLFGLLGGPLFGILVNGALFPHINSWGAMLGGICSLVASFWVGVGAILNPKRSGLLPRSTAGCNDTVNNVTAVFTTMLTENTTALQNATSPAITEPNGDPFLPLYRLSYWHYATLALLISVLVGTIVSASTGFNRERYIAPHLLIPGVRRVYCCLPYHWRKKLWMDPTDLSAPEKNHTMLSQRRGSKESESGGDENGQRSTSELIALT